MLGPSRKTVARILCNYAARNVGAESDVKVAPAPYLVDLDVASGSLVMPGVMAMRQVAVPFSLEDPDSSEMHSPDLAFFYGHASHRDNPKLFRKLAGKLADALEQRIQAAKDAGAADNTGAIIIGPGDADEALVEELIKTFSADLVCVIGNERFYANLQQRIASTSLPCHAFKLPKSGGVVSKDAAYRKALFAKQFRAYFSGHRGELTPFSLGIPLELSSPKPETTDSSQLNGTNRSSTSNFIRVYRFGQESSMAPSSALPIGSTRRVDEARAQRIEAPAEASSSLLYSIVALIHSESNEISSITVPELDAPIAGLLHVTAVDVNSPNGCVNLTVLSPCGLPLPSSTALVGSIRWIESRR